jgi:hypothetical protein
MAGVPRKVFLIYGVSLVLFCLSPFLRSDKEARVPGELTDHMAHWGTAILAWYDGFDIYRHPIRELCAPPPDNAPWEGPAVGCSVPGHPEVPTFSVNWTEYPSVYPPGAALFAGPPAAVFAWGGASFSHANLLMILECIVVAHVASLLLLLCLWRAPAETPEGALLSTREWNACIGLFLMPLLHFYIVSWGLRGMYDAVSLAGVLAGVLLYRRDRPLAALLALSFAIFTHFRALWYLPLMAAALWQVLRSMPQPFPPRRTVLALVAAAGMALIAAHAFLLLLPALRAFPINNPVNVDRIELRQALVPGLPAVFVLIALAWNRYWLTAASTAWQIFMLVQTREVRGWHALFALPLIGMAGLEKRGAPAAVLILLVLFATQCSVVFKTWPFSLWLATIVTKS